jgi:xanthine dehydrogenase accessory factor
VARRPTGPYGTKEHDMLDIAEELLRWARQGRPFAVATVVAVHGSAPRQPGAALAVDGTGTALGSVSGGCVEAAVYELCARALRDGRTVTERFGHDGDPFAPALTCGGSIEVLVDPVLPPGAPGSPAPAGPDPYPRRDLRPADTGPAGHPGHTGRPAAAPVALEPRPGPPARAPRDAGRHAVLSAALSAAARGESAALVRVARGPAPLLGRALLVRAGGRYDGTLGLGPGTDRAAAAGAGALLDAGRTDTVVTAADHTEDPLTLLVETSVPPPRMIVFGALDHAAALVRIGGFLGHRVTVCDPRPVFATRARFPGADEVVVDRPDRYLRSTPTDSRTVLCVLTHDVRFDIPLLETALRLPVAYVGAMGSRRTHEERLGLLRAAGLAEHELARLRGPIGLDLGARTPEETALSIAAEIVADRRGGTGRALTATRTPIHPDTRPAPGTAPRG